MYIEEVEIYKILECEHMKLSFRHGHNHVYIVQGSKNCPKRLAIGTALKLICSAQYASTESLANLQNLHKGYVRVKLLIKRKEDKGEEDGVIATAADSVKSATGDPAMSNNETDAEDSDEPSTSQQARLREQRRTTRKRQLKEKPKSNIPRPKSNTEPLQYPPSYQRIEALRDFRCNPEVIEFTVDGSSDRQKCSVYVFQGKFRTNIDYILRQPNLSRNASAMGNWIDFFTTKLNGCMTRDEQISKLFSDFVKLFLKNQYKEYDLLPQLTTCCLVGHTALDVMLATSALKIFNHVRLTFEFITCMEYTVWFLIPYKGRYVSVEEVGVENFKFNNVSTCIKLKNGTSNTQHKEYIWTNAEHAIQDLLIIAFQLVMTFHLKRGIVYLQEELNTVKDYQTIKFLFAANMQNNDNETEQQLWPQKNYLQRIVEACNKMQITAIIDYPGGLPVAPVNCHLIKCFRDENSGQWELKVVKNASNCNASKFVSEVEQGLKDY